MCRTDGRTLWLLGLLSEPKNVFLYFTVMLPFCLSLETYISLLIFYKDRFFFENISASFLQGCRNACLEMQEQQHLVTSSFILLAIPDPNCINWTWKTSSWTRNFRWTIHTQLSTIKGFASIWVQIHLMGIHLDLKRDDDRRIEHGFDIHF